MTTEEMKALFDRHEEEFNKFKSIPESERLSSRRDIHAFILLNRKCPGTTDMVTGSAHDEIWLDVSLDDLAATADESTVLQLVRCGVRLDSERECLAMFV